MSRRAFYILAAIVFLAAVLVAILLPAETPLENPRGTVNLEPRTRGAGLGARIAIALGGFVLALFLVWLGNRTTAGRPRELDTKTRRRPAA